MSVLYESLAHFDNCLEYTIGCNRYPIFHNGKIVDVIIRSPRDSSNDSNDPLYSSSNDTQCIITNSTTEHDKPEIFDEYGIDKIYQKLSKIFDILSPVDLASLGVQSVRIQIFTDIDSTDFYIREVYVFTNNFSFFINLVIFAFDDDLTNMRSTIDVRLKSLLGSHTIPTDTFDDIDCYVICLSEMISNKCSIHWVRKSQSLWIEKWYILFYDNLIRNYPEHTDRILRMKTALILNKLRV